jgi:hypothetical protein
VQINAKKTTGRGSWESGKGPKSSASAPEPTSTTETTPVPPATSSGGTTCSADVNGWTTPLPSKANLATGLTSRDQQGSRLHYISVLRGNDDTGAVYFWDGSRIIDSMGQAADASGVAYGTDPMRPSAAVKPFKRWAYVGPRATSTSDIGSLGPAGGPMPVFRGGYPDWWLFSRGETFDLTTDLVSFARQTNSDATGVSASLAVPGGRSISERMIVGAYGDTCAPRPRFIHPQLGFVSRYFRASDTTIFRNVAYLSLHFDGHDRLPGATYEGITLLGQTPASTDILFEDVWVDGVPSNIQSSAQVTLRRSLITDAFRTDGGHVQGLYYSSTRQGILRIEESTLLRNGFSHGDPKTMSWPPSGTQIWDAFSRNLYLSGETNSMQSGMFDSVSMIGASGDQFRPGMRVERNFFYQGYVGIGAHGGYADSEGPTGTVLDNVLQRFVGTGTNDNRGQPGWGFLIAGGSHAVEVARNVVTGAQHAANSYGVEIKPLFQDCNVPFKYPTRANLIHSNVLDSSNAAAAVGSFDGVTETCYNYTFRGITGNAVSDNVLVNANSRESEYVPVGPAVGSAPDTTFARNRVFPDRATAAAAMGWPDASRTLKTYLLSRGVNVTSADAFPEYFELASQQRRGNWRVELTGPALVNYVRGGFAMPSVPLK